MVPVTLVPFMCIVTFAAPLCKVTCAASVSVQWLDTSIRGKGQINFRSRLVATDFPEGYRDRDDLYSGTPPLEAIHNEIDGLRVGTSRASPGTCCLWL